jgi:glyoxylase-like metal-dependent hydrolase (beta-lactamase superfamily II)
MQEIKIGDVTITSIVEREGPRRKPKDMFLHYDEAIASAHLATMDPVSFDAASGKMFITYQTFVVRTPHHVILVDTCTGDDKGYPAPMDFDKSPWVDGFKKAGLTYEDVDYVFCTHLHIDHSGWNTTLVNGRWTPTFPKAKYVFHKREYAAWEEAAAKSDPRPGSDAGNVFRMNCLPIVEAGQALLVDDDYALDDTVWLTPTPGHSPCHCCVNIKSKGLRAVVTGDMVHHALQCREPDWSTIFCWDPKQAAHSRRKFLTEIADTSTLMLPIHFPNPTVGRIRADGNAFHWDYVRS